MRVVPRPNEAINETWIADRDRFSYEGIYSADRLHDAACCARATAAGARPTGRRRSKRRPRACRARRRRAAGRARASLEHARGAVSAGRLAQGLGSRQHRSPPAPAGFPRSGRRSGCAGTGHGHRRRRQLMRCWWSVPTCGARCRCWRIACARRRCAARALSSSIRRRSSTCSRWRSTLTAPPAQMVRELAGVLAAALARRPAGARSAGAAAEQRARPVDAQRAIAASLQTGERAHLAGRAGAAPSGYAELRVLARDWRASPARRWANSRKAAMPPAPTWPAALPHREAAGQARAERGLNARADARAAAARLPAAAAPSPGPTRVQPQALADAARSAPFVVAITPFAIAGDAAASRRCCCRSAPSPRPPAPTSTSKAAGRASRGAAQPLGRGAPGLEDPARARQSAGSAGLRLPVLGAGARRTARALVERRRHRGYGGAFADGDARRHRGAASMCRCTRSIRCVRRAASLQRTRDGRAAAAAVSAGAGARTGSQAAGRRCPASCALDRCSSWC